MGGRGAAEWLAALPARPRPTALAAWALWSVNLALVSLRYVLQTGATGPEAPSTFGFLFNVLGLLIPMAFPTVGALVAARRPGHAAGWLLLAMGTGWGFADLMGLYSTHVRATGAGPVDASMAAWLHGWSSYVSNGALVLLILLFPDGRPPSRRWRPVAWLAVVWSALGVVVALLAPLPVRMQDGGQVAKPIALVGPLGDLLALLSPAVDALAVPLVFAALASLLVRLRRSRGRERQQLKWVASASSLAVLALTTYVVTGGSLGAVGTPPPLLLVVYLCIGLLPISVGIAVLRYRLYEIDFLINRGLVYGALSACVVALYIVVVGSLGALFHASGDLVASLLATGVVAVLFQPLRERLQRAVNRLLYGERDDPYSVLMRLDGRLGAALAPEAVLPTIAEAVAQALRLPYAALALMRGGELRVVAAHGTPGGETVELPLSYQGEEVGRLILAPRAPGEPFDAADRRLLEDVARHAGVAAHAARLTADLHRSRERLVSAREEERRRLRRDLHDGVGPTLASMTLQAEAAREALYDRDRADALLAELVGELQSATAEIRRLVYELRPPALDDLGLVGALTAYAARYEHGANGVRVAVEAPEVLPPLPAAVEVAAYRIALEALTNVARHARAGACTLRLALADGRALRLEVVDDGQGIRPPNGRGSRMGGLGLASMRERAAELGGSFLVESAPGGGTRVIAELPLEERPVAAAVP